MTRRRSHLLETVFSSDTDRVADDLLANWSHAITGYADGPLPVKSTSQVFIENIYRRLCPGEEVEQIGSDDVADEIAADAVEQAVRWMNRWFPTHARVLRTEYVILPTAYLRQVAEENNIDRGGPVHRWRAAALAKIMPEDYDQILLAARDILVNRVRDMLKQAA